MNQRLSSEVVTRAEKVKRLIIAFAITVCVVIIGLALMEAQVEIDNELRKNKPDAKLVVLVVLPIGDGCTGEICNYTVKKGDGYERIERKYNTPAYMIRLDNGLEMSDVLQPGQQLVFIKYTFKPYTTKASWYGPGFDQRKMANNEVYDQDDVLIAHRHLPFGIKVRITRLDNSLSIIAEVKDRGPYATDKYGNYTRDIDLSKGAAKLLGAIEPGVIVVKIEPLNL